jgi:hypothetical protein
MKRRLEDWLILVLMIEGVLALTLLIVFTLYRMIVPDGS